MKSQGRLVIFLGLLLSFLHSSYALAENPLIFGTPPTQSVEITKANYQPLANYLGDLIGRPIVVKPSATFHEYTRKMKAGYYDMILDGPHFIKYRLDKMKHIVLVKQPGELKFAVVVKADSKVTNYKELVNKRVCAPSIPHLGTLTYLNLYNSPIRTPELVPVQSFKHAIECIKTGKAVAAIVRDKFWFKKVKNKGGLKIIYITQNKIPARGLTVNTTVINSDSQEKLIAALTSDKAKELIKTALSTIGGTEFIKAEQSEYANLTEVLSMVWGFHI